MDFFKKLKATAQKNKSLLCLGIDPDVSKIPAFLKGEEGIFNFFKSIIEATEDLVCAYKPNIAFFEALGVKSLETLKKIIRYIPGNIPVILDAKRADVGHSAAAYAAAAFTVFKADAITVNPYLGFEALEPFLEYKNKGIFVLCVTTNKGSGEFQKSGRPALFEKVARAAKKNNQNKNLGLVVGASRPAEMKIVRRLAPALPFLVPGIGAQKGNLEKTLAAGWSEKIYPPLIINASRSLTYIASGSNFAVATRSATLKLRQEINQLITKI
jgi:orotidine-5'-phosphate decarboxylase